MDYKKALSILEIELKVGEKLDIKYLKRQYHKLALLNHPDKNNNSTESTEKFKLINESFIFWKRELNIFNMINKEVEDETADLNGNESQESIHNNYMMILKIFIENIIQELCKGENEYKELIKTIISDIVTGCKKISLKLFESLSKEASLEVYGFLSKYKNILRVSNETIEEVKQIIKEKYKKDQMYILNPSIEDLLANNIYKLNIDGEIYYVPLWYDTVSFDKKDGSEIIVDCVPELPDNIYIDENGDVNVSVDISFTNSLYKEKTISIFIGKKKMEIPINQLYIRETQTYCFYGKGISDMNERDIYEVGNKSNIICRINFV